MSDSVDSLDESQGYFIYAKQENMRAIFLLIKSLYIDMKINRRMKSKRFGKDYWYTRQVLHLLEYNTAILEELKLYIGNNR